MDAQLFNACYRENRDLFVRRAQHYYRLSRHDAEDIVQQAAVLALENDAPVAPGAVFWQTVRRVAGDRKKQEHRRDLSRLEPDAVRPEAFVERRDDVDDWPTEEQQALTAWRERPRFRHVATACGWDARKTRRVLTRVATRLDAADRCLA